MSANDLRQQCKEKIVLFDGAMGTYFASHYDAEIEAEQANLSHPEWITAIHKEYIEAGADVIRTNTFAVNHILFPTKEERQAVIKSAVACARSARSQFIEAANKKETSQNVLRTIHIAASIGTIRQDIQYLDQDIMEEYKEIVDTFLQQKIDVFVLETFAQVNWVQKIAAYIKQVAPSAFVLTEFSVNPAGYTKFGYSMNQIVAQLAEDDTIDAYGFNCGVGTTHMNHLLSNLKLKKDCLLSVLPNAGYQMELRGRRKYSEDPVYYAKQMEQIVKKGANIIGGCCGTSPVYIKNLKKLLSKPYPKHIVTGSESDEVMTEPNPFIDKLKKGEEKVFVVELDSPFGIDSEKFEQGAYLLKENGVDMVTVSDSPMARARADSCMMALALQNHSDLAVMPHVACRDRNLIGLRSLMLGAHISGIRNMLIITGDPVAKDDRSMIKGVFDVNSIRLMEYVQNMNQEVFGAEPMYYGGALNYDGINVDAIVHRMEQKIEKGCSYFLTQPIFSAEDVERIHVLKKRVNTKILCGIMPLVSYKNALFMHNEMPGIHVSDEVLHQYRPDMSRSEAEEVAVQVSVSIASQLMDVADGFYIMTPFQRVGLVNRVIDGIRKL